MKPFYVKGNFGQGQFPPSHEGRNFVWQTPTFCFITTHPRWYRITLISHIALYPRFSNTQCVPQGGLAFGTTPANHLGTLHTTPMVSPQPADPQVSSRIIINDWERTLRAGFQPSRLRHLPAILNTTAAGGAKIGKIPTHLLTSRPFPGACPRTSTEHRSVRPCPRSHTFEQWQDQLLALYTRTKGGREGSTPGNTRVSKTRRIAQTPTDSPTGRAP